MRPHLFAVLILLALATAACDLPERSEFPVVRLFADPAAAVLFDRPQLDHYAKLEGTRVELDTQTSETLETRLRGGAVGPDLVATSDPELWRRLVESGAIAPDPWRFSAHRETILLVVPASAGDIGVLPLPVAILGDGAGDGDHLTVQALMNLGLWERARDGAIAVETPAELVRVLRSGRAGSAALHGSDLALLPSGMRVHVETDPHSAYPGFIAIGVREGLERPIRAHRAFLQLSHALRQSELTYVTPEAGGRMDVGGGVLSK